MVIVLRRKLKKSVKMSSEWIGTEKGRKRTKEIKQKMKNNSSI